jgi:hypothetical protein
MLFVHVHFDLCLSLELLHEFSLYSVFQNLPAMVQCVASVNTLVQKQGPFSWAPKYKMVMFLKMAIHIS